LCRGAGEDSFFPQHALNERAHFKRSKNIDQGKRKNMDKLIVSAEGLRDVSRLKLGSFGAAEW
jgi:hypothetical protein